MELLTKELDDIKMAHKAVLSDIDKTKTQLQDDIHSIQLADRKISQLEANRQAYKTYGLGEGVEFIMNAKIDGVYAPLSQLMEVDAEYTTAISEAIGGAGRFIAVEDENVATRVVSLLKEQKRGWATCLPLNKMRPAPNNLALPKMNGVIDFAINLIDFDDKFIDVFFYALNDTLIVDNMTTAKKLMGKYRIITLDGEVFDKRGAISGGSKKRSAPTFGKADDRELNNYKERYKELEAAYKARSEKLKNLELKSEELRAKHSNASNSLQAAKYEYSQNLQAHKDFERVIEEKLKRVNELTPEIKKTENLLDKIEQRHIEISENITNVQTEVIEVEKFIDEGELKKLQEMTQGIEAEIKEIEGKISTVESNISRESYAINFAQQMVELKEGDIKKMTSDNVMLNEDKGRLELEITEIQKILVDLEKQSEELGKDIEELRNLRDKVQHEIIEAEKAKNILETEIERIQEAIEGAKARRNEYEPQFEAIVQELKDKGIKADELAPTEVSVDEIMSKIQKLQKKMDDLGLVNMRAIDDYETVLNRQKELSVKIMTLENEKNEIRNRMTGYENLKKETFLDTFNSVNSHFKTVFADLTDGYGELILTNPENPFLGGLTVEGNLKHKEKQKLAGMSGGEKTLVALSLVFAIQRHMPAPFYALDEVDAALDGFNVERIANMIDAQSKSSQFIAISQRSQMNDMAQRVIGVVQDRGRTKVSGITNSK